MNWSYFSKAFSREKSFSFLYYHKIVKLKTTVWILFWITHPLWVHCPKEIPVGIGPTFKGVFLTYFNQMLSNGGSRKFTSECIFLRIQLNFGSYLFAIGIWKYSDELFMSMQNKNIHFSDVTGMYLILKLQIAFIFRLQTLKGFDQWILCKIYWLKGLEPQKNLYFCKL